MRPNSCGPKKAPTERVIKDIRRATRRHFSAADKIRIVLDGLRGGDGSAELCRKDGIAQPVLHRGRRSSWRPANAVLPVTPRAVTGDEVKGLRKKATALKEVVAEQALEIRLQKSDDPKAGFAIDRPPFFLPAEGAGRHLSNPRDR